MSIKKLSKLTGLPEQTIKIIKRSGITNVDFKPKKQDTNNNISGASNPIASEFEFLVKQCKMLILDFKPDNPETYTKVTKLTYLLMTRFSFDEITKMLDAPVLIPSVVENHTRELSQENSAYPNLRVILRKLDFNKIHNVFELGDKIGENLILPADKRTLISDVQKKCSELTAQLSSIKSPLWLSNIMLILAIIFVGGAPFVFFSNSKVTLTFALIPVIGILFAIVRSRLLSWVEKKLSAAKALNETLTKMLANFELNVDFCTLKVSTYFEGNYLNYGSPSAAASDYIDEITSKSSVLLERAWSANELLKKIRFEG